MEGSFQFQDPVTGRWETDAHLPFKMWTDSLPLCAKALRAKRKPQDLDLADIVEIKYCITRQNYRDAVVIAMKAIERNPHQGYWYYAISMAHDPVKGLKAAKQGLKCTQLTPFVKYQLMQRAVDHAGNLGIEILQQMPDVGDQKWYEGIAFLHSALEDAKTYISEAPPDNRNMKNVLYWYILLMVTINDLSPDLHELESARQKLAIADEIMQIVGSPPPLTHMRLTQATVLKYYKESIARFSSLSEKAGVECSDNFVNPTSEESEDKMATWLAKLDLEDEKLDSKEMYRVGEESKSGGLKLVSVDGDSLSLYRCGWCGNPSASLRKCSGCTKIRYCDVHCQKSAWSSHKKACKKE
ncbi:hypothetical protein AN958_05382 [Leucoagaricus sp. SymC.cos]|nr:hypothetical protein AN958_05382 [Leucoagaricus sp. SymC.cos]